MVLKTSKFPTIGQLKVRFKNIDKYTPPEWKEFVFKFGNLEQLFLPENCASIQIEVS